MWQRIANHLTVRLSLIIVLLFFIVALVAGAALGILSLKQNNSALQQIVHHQGSASALNTSLDRYKEAQAILGRALASYVQNVGDLDYTTASSWVEQGAGTSTSIDNNTLYLLTQAELILASSNESFERFKMIEASDGNTTKSLERLVRSYDLLMEKGVAPLVASLEKGDVAAFNWVLDSQTRGLEEDLYIEVMHQSTTQNEIMHQHAERQAKQYALVKQLVGIAMVLVAIFSLVVYWFLNQMVLAPLRRIDGHFAQIAQGNLTEAINTDSTNEIGVLFKSLDQMRMALQNVVKNVRAGVEQIRYDAVEVHQGALDLSSRSEQQAAALQQTAASMEELASTVRQNTENAFKANEVAQQSSHIVDQSGQMVSSVVQTMDGISASADKMAEIIRVIDGIAFQTNILALNAAVEAARAGEQGRGFAVVAGEVRSLAQRSAQAAREVGELISDSLEQVKKGSAQAHETGAAVNQVVHSVAGVTTLMGEISAASNEQSLGIEQVNRAVVEMDSVVQQNVHLVHQAASAGKSLQQYAEQLAQVVAVFRTDEQTIIDITESQNPEEELHYFSAEPIYITER